MSISRIYTGGCQCGAVRYRVEGTLSDPHLCHCRMCQKAAGNYFMPLANAPRARFVVTRGQPGWFSSSDIVRRGFCPACGTPLFYDNTEGNRVNFTIGSLDHPELFPPHANTGNEGRVPWFDTLTSIEHGGETETGQEDWASAIKSTNHQHPDHDTTVWPPKSE